MQIQGIETPRRTLQIPVPKVVDTNGGAFEINIGEGQPHLYYKHLLK